MLAEPLPPLSGQKQVSRYLKMYAHAIAGGAHTSLHLQKASWTHKIKHLDYGASVFIEASVPQYWWPKR
jgi:hypothetical protein